MVLLVKRDDVELSSFISVGGCDIIVYDIFLLIRVADHVCILNYQKNLKTKISHN